MKPNMKGRINLSDGVSGEILAIEKNSMSETDWAMWMLGIDCKAEIITESKKGVLNDFYDMMCNLPEIANPKVTIEADENYIDNYISNLMPATEKEFLASIDNFEFFLKKESDPLILYSEIYKDQTLSEVLDIALDLMEDYGLEVPQMTAVVSKKKKANKKTSKVTVTKIQTKKIKVAFKPAMKPSTRDVPSTATKQNQVPVVKQQSKKKEVALKPTIKPSAQDLPSTSTASKQIKKQDVKAKTEPIKKRGPYKKKEPKDPKVFYCKLCSVTCKSPSSLVTHVDAIHLLKRQYICRFCDSDFSRKSHVKEHEANHLIDKEKSVCRTCHKQFNKKAMQEKKKKQICKFCLEIFGKKNKLTEHLEIHKVGTEYPCTICDNKFVSIDRLNSHLKTHEEIKFDCAFCHSQLKSMQTFKVHIMSIHEDQTDEELAEVLQEMHNSRFDCCYSGMCS